MRVTCGIATKNRYELLVQTLQSLAAQTVKTFDIIIVDDTDNPVDIRNFPAFQSVFYLFNEYGIGFEVVYGAKRGQHYSHQLVQDKSPNDWIWRIDDDEIAEPNVLETLLAHCHDGVGAAASLVIIPPAQMAPKGAANVINHMELPNVQWYKHPYWQVRSVEHLTSSFIYRKGIVSYDLSLSPAAHREETIFTHELYRAGHRLIIDTSCTTWHFRASQGGIRSHKDASFWENDEKKFQAKLAEWGVSTHDPAKLVVVDGGRGDHVIIKSLIHDFKIKYGKLIVATCFPEILADEDVEQISIADAITRLGGIDHLNIYQRMIDWQWKGTLRDAFRKLYL